MPKASIEIEVGREGKVEQLAKQAASLMTRNYDCNRNETHKSIENTVNQFCKFLGNEYGMQKLVNFGNKHVVAYTEKLKELGLSTGYIKTSVSNLQHFSRTVGCKNHLEPTEKIFAKCGIEKRVQGTMERAWNNREVKEMGNIAEIAKRPDVVYTIKLGRQFGLRIEGITTLSKGQVTKALTRGELTVTEKGGLTRSIPITTKEQTQTLKDLLEIANRDKLLKKDKIFRDSTFMNKGKKIKGQNSVSKCQRSIQNFIAKNREHVQDYDRKTRREYKISEKERIVEKTELTVHGLRHAYAKEQYTNLRKAGLSDKEAALKVSKFLGHGRASITRYYLVCKQAEEELQVP